MVFCYWGFCEGYWFEVLLQISLELSDDGFSGSSSCHRVYIADIL